MEADAGTRSRAREIAIVPGIGGSAADNLRAIRALGSPGPSQARVEVVLKHDCRRDRVQSLPTTWRSPLDARDHLLGLPGRQPFVPEPDRNRKRAKRLNVGVCLVDLRAAAPVHVQRKPYYQFLC